MSDNNTQPSQDTKPLIDDKTIIFTSLNDMAKDLEWQNERNINFWNFFSHFIYPFGLVLLMLVVGYIAFHYHILFGSILICIVGFFIYKVFYCYFNLKAMLLTTKGLELHTRFDGVISYCYGTFTIKKNIERGTFGISASDKITIASTYQRGIMFYSPVQYLRIDKSGAILSQHTQQALESMNPQEKANLYKLYQSNIEIFFNETINHNVFAIDFSPYKKELKKYFYDELQEALQALNTKEKAMLYENYKVLFERTKSIQYNIDYFVPYRQEIESYLKDKND